MINLGIPILEKLRDDMFRLGIAPVGSESIEQFSSNLETNLYMLSSRVNMLLDITENL